MWPNESYFLGAYWGNLPETGHRCTERTLGMLIEMQTCGRPFQRWSLPSRSVDTLRRREVPLTQDRLLRLYLQSIRPGFPDAVGSEIYIGGYSLSLVTMLDEDDPERKPTWPVTFSYDLSILCGSYASLPHHYAPNRCELSPPDTALAKARFLQREQLTCLMERIVAAWHPAWAVVTSNRLRQRTPNDGPGAPTVGWLTYFSDLLVGDRPIDVPNRTVRCADQGLLIVAQEDAMSGDNPADVTTLVQLGRRLRRSGLLTPVPYWEPWPA